MLVWREQWNAGVKPQTAVGRERAGSRHLIGQRIGNDHGLGLEDGVGAKGNIARDLVDVPPDL